MKPFTIESKEFERGSFIITRGDNKEMENTFDKTVTELANKFQVELTVAKSGLVDKGKDFGSQYSPLIKKKNMPVKLF